MTKTNCVHRCESIAIDGRKEFRQHPFTKTQTNNLFNIQTQKKLFFLNNYF